MEAGAAAAAGGGGVAGGGMVPSGLASQMAAATAGQDPLVFMEACAAKAVGAGAMGAVMGGGMGMLLGGYGSIAPPLSLPGRPDAPKVPMKHQLRESWLSTARRMRGWGKNFAMVTLVFSGVECVIEKYRAKHDIVNGTAAGCITGAVLAASSGPAGMCVGCAGFAAFSAGIETLMGGH